MNIYFWKLFLQWTKDNPGKYYYSEHCTKQTYFISESNSAFTEQ